MGSLYAFTAHAPGSRRPWYTPCLPPSSAPLPGPCPLQPLAPASGHGLTVRLQAHAPEAGGHGTPPAYLPAVPPSWCPVHCSPWPLLLGHGLTVTPSSPCPRSRRPWYAPCLPPSSAPLPGPRPLQPLAPASGAWAHCTPSSPCPEAGGHGYAPCLPPFLLSTSLHPVGYWLLAMAHGPWPIAHGPLPMAHCPLPIAYCPLPNGRFFFFFFFFSLVVWFRCRSCARCTAFKNGLQGSGQEEVWHNALCMMHSTAQSWDQIASRPLYSLLYPALAPKRAVCLLSLLACS